MLPPLNEFIRETGIVMLPLKTSVKSHMKEIYCQKTTQISSPLMHLFSKLKHPVLNFFPAPHGNAKAQCSLPPPPPPPVWFYAFDPRGTSRFTFLAFRPQSLLGYLLSPPALSTIISQQERSAVGCPSGGRNMTHVWVDKTHGNRGITLNFLTSTPRITFGYDERVSW